MSKLGSQTIFIVKICLRVHKSINSYEIQKIMLTMRIKLIPSDCKSNALLTALQRFHKRSKDYIVSNTQCRISILRVPNLLGQK